MLCAKLELDDFQIMGPGSKNIYLFIDIAFIVNIAFVVVRMYYGVCGHLQAFGKPS
jgi:hypothetical protein